MNLRNLKLDNLKALLILLVVFCHTIYSYEYYNPEPVTNIVYLIYIFHMPIFCMISGYFSKKEYSKEYYFNLFITFLLLNTTFSIYDYLKNGDFNLISVKYSSWYLIDLLFWRIIYTKPKDYTKLFSYSLTMDKRSAFALRLFFL